MLAGVVRTSVFEGMFRPGEISTDTLMLGAHKILRIFRIPSETLEGTPTIRGRVFRSRGAPASHAHIG